jgi:hypothetical protein
MEDPTPIVDVPSKPTSPIRRALIAMSILFGLAAVGFVAWLPRNFWLLDALLFQSAVASGLLAALAVGGLQFLQLQRFSLRSLLIVTTIVAIVLGFAVWLAR